MQITGVHGLCDLLISKEYAKVVLDHVLLSDGGNKISCQELKISLNLTKSHSKQQHGQQGNLRSFICLN